MTKKWSDIRAEGSKLSPERAKQVEMAARLEALSLGLHDVRAQVADMLDAIRVIVDELESAPKREPLEYNDDVVSVREIVDGEVR